MAGTTSEHPAGSSARGELSPRVSELAPGMTAAFVREALHRAIRGLGPLPPAAVAADRQLAEQHGDVEKAVQEVTENHVRYAGAQGFVTNLGGAVAATVAIPANISGLAMIQCRMIAGIAHLRGYDLEDRRVRNAILVTLLGEDRVGELVSAQRIPAPPMAMATSPAHDPEVDRIVSTEVASDLIARVAGKRLAGRTVRRIPLMGGVIGAGADGVATWQVGRYAERELLPRARR